MLSSDWIFGGVLGRSVTRTRSRFEHWVELWLNFLALTIRHSSSSPTAFSIFLVIQHVQRNKQSNEYRSEQPMHRNGMHTPITALISHNAQSANSRLYRAHSPTRPKTLHYLQALRPLPMRYRSTASNLSSMTAILRSKIGTAFQRSKSKPRRATNPSKSSYRFNRR